MVNKSQTPAQNIPSKSPDKHQDSANEYEGEDFEKDDLV